MSVVCGVKRDVVAMRVVCPSICSPEILVFFWEGWSPLLAPARSGACALCRRNRGMLMEIAEGAMGSAGGGADRGPLSCQSDPGTSSDET